MTSWRIDQSKYDRYGKQFNPVERMKALGVLILDTRLQAIAAAPRCEHDRIDEHDYSGKVEGGRYTIVCLGAPRLRALLDALTEEAGDERLH